jgi:hypothetical protein
VQERGTGRPPGAVIIRARHRGTVIFGCLTALWLLALAAVFEDFGDKIFRTARANAREAYRRAASAQRAFAGHAPSPPESAARLAEANRIDGKVQN